MDEPGLKSETVSMCRTGSLWKKTMPPSFPAFPDPRSSWFLRKKGEKYREMILPPVHS